MHAKPKVHITDVRDRFFMIGRQENVNIGIRRFRPAHALCRYAGPVKAYAEGRCVGAAELDGGPATCVGGAAVTRISASR
ncbi:hypothetical protein H4W81_007934 [Nonomuraea africana]|uniref:Uncharacterized protein n=1 Tax=Nonomuraea africana TaxID=46171 RepID=A0ABR9KTU1_9ACTN|nr:hypothetical protein [Nonomuraea africana]